MLRRFSVAAALYLAFAISVAYATANALHARSIPGALPAAQGFSSSSVAPRYLVLIVLDGARPDYFGLTSLPHVDALRANGTQFTNAVSGILEAETPAGHATIGSGSRPDRTGILGFDWATNTDRYSLFSPDQMGTLEQILQNTHVPTIAGLLKKQYPGARVVALSGHKYYAAAPLGGPDADAIMYYQGDPKGRYVPVAVPGHAPPATVLNTPGLISPTTHLPDGMEDDLATKLALASVQQMHPRALLINYPEFDWPLGHVDGGNLDRSKVITDMKGFDADLGRIEDLYRKEGILDQTLFVITADHGMMPITRFIPASVITNAVAQAGTTAPDIAPNSSDFVWVADPTRAQAVAQNVMRNRDPGIQSAYYLTTVNGKPTYAPSDPSAISKADDVANQYLLSSLLNGHEPSVVVFGKEGTSFSDPGSKWKADHGGNTWQSQHVPLIMAGAGVRSGVTTSSAAQLDDVAPTVLTAMGVTPVGMEGHVLTDALNSTTSDVEQGRTDEIGQMDPVLAALSSQDK